MPNRTKAYHGQPLSKRKNATDNRKPRPVTSTGGGQVGMSTGSAVQL